MMAAKAEEVIHYYPEEVNRSHGSRLDGTTQDQNHMANWIDCVRSRKTPNAPVETGYRSALAVHMANLSYRQKQRVTLEEAKAYKPEY